MKVINIISFDVPYPANYGGVIDVFYKLKYFHKHGIDVHLHCFEYGRGKQPSLEKYCKSVHYYKRKTGIASQLSSLPYIVKSRTAGSLKKNLLLNDYPILFEGLHSCFLLDEPSLKHRFKIFRESNIEHHYYQHLAKVESNAVKKKYYQTEAKKLKKYEPVIKHADLSLVVSLTDLTYFQKEYPENRIEYLPSFHPGEQINIKPGRGAYILYHGNLSVAENSNAVKHLVENVFSKINLPVIIAGLNPGKELIQLIDGYPHVSLVANPNDDEMHELVQHAHINLLYTDQATGLKLKLLNVLFNGRHCLVNSKMVAGTSLSKACTVKDTNSDLVSEINLLFGQEFKEDAISSRSSHLLEYSNDKNLKKLLSLLPE